MIFQTSLSRHSEVATAQPGEGSYSSSDFSKCSVAAEHSLGFEKKVIIRAFCFGFFAKAKFSL